MKNLLKDLSAVCTLPILYLFLLSLLSELFSRGFGMNVLDDSLLYSGGVFIVLTVVCSLWDSFIPEESLK